MSTLHAQAPPLILDGGLATELEALGHDLRHRLWSARLLLEAPDAILAVHKAYLEAGADCITSASYQATMPALQDMGLSKSQAAAVIAFSVELALQARDAFAQALPAGRARPRVVASMGPYGAFLADGSEFRGNYGLSAEALHAHHVQQWEVLSATPADWIACETVPSLLEGEVLAGLFRQSPQAQGWISFSCRDDAHLNDGTPIAACVPLIENTPGLIGLGINCTAPQHISGLLRAARAAGLRKPAIVYPNSGETFDSKHMAWQGKPLLDDFVKRALEWRGLGAAVIGGCCRTKPVHIMALRGALVK